jgi:uncharacterized OB-fold protein
VSSTLDTVSALPPPRIAPPVTEVNRPFWTGGSDGLLLIQFCESCERWVYPPTPDCPDCESSLEWKPVSGAGSVFTFTINRHQYHPDVPPPYIIAIVELAEQPGLRFTTDIVDCEPAAVAIGLPVQVSFEPAGDEAWAPVFRPA